MKHLRRSILVPLVMAVIVYNGIAQNYDSHEGSASVLERNAFFDKSDDFTLSGSIEFFVNWKYWTLMGEPVAHHEAAWEIGPDIRVIGAPFLQHFTLPPGGLVVPENIVETIGIYRLYFASGFHTDFHYPMTQANYFEISFDPGVMSKAFVKESRLDGISKLSHEEQKKYFSFNVPGSPEWNDFLSNTSYYDPDSSSVIRSSISKETAKRIFRNEGFNLGNTLRILQVDYNLWGVREWLLKLDLNAAKEAGNSTVEIEEAIDQARSEHERLNRLMESQKREIAARTSPGGNPSDMDGKNIRMNLLLLIDTSGSMGGEKIISARRAAIESVEDALGKNIQVAVWTFSGSCGNPITGRVDLTQSKSALSSFIQSQRPGGRTPLYAALQQANQYLQKENDKTGIPGMIILLADGNDSCGGREAALSSLSNGSIMIRHEVIGLGVSNGSTAQQQLSEIAGNTNGRYHGDVKSEDLGKVFSSVMAGIEIMDMFGQFGFTDSPESSQPKDEQNESLSSMDSIMEGW